MCRWDGSKGQGYGLVSTGEFTSVEEQLKLIYKAEKACKGNVNNDTITTVVMATKMLSVIDNRRLIL